MTGIYTSSVHDESYAKHGEYLYHVYNGSATPIKTHHKEYKVKTSGLLGNITKAILLLRDPFDALKAEFKRRKSGKTEQITEEQLSGNYENDCRPTGFLAI